jgi:ABC-2 type transport system permease protein
MSAPTLIDQPAGAPQSLASAGTRQSSLPGLKVTQRRVIASEWTKLRSLRSSWITLAVSVALTIGLGALITAVIAAHWDGASLRERASFSPAASSLNGLLFSQLAIAVLGVMLFSGEYATGMIRATLTSVPKRLPVLWAKLAVFGAVVGLVSMASAFIAFFLGQSLLSSKGISTTLSAPGVLRMVIGAGLYLLVIGLMGVAMGALLRSTAAGISALVALLFVIPPILGFLPSSWQDAIGPYLPSTAGQSLWGNPDGKHLEPWTGFAVLCLWALVTIAAAAVRLMRQDA